MNQVMEKNNRASAKSIRETARLSVACICRVAKWRRWEQFGVALLIVMLLVLILR